MEEEREAEAEVMVTFGVIVLNCEMESATDLRMLCFLYTVPGAAADGWAAAEVDVVVVVAEVAVDDCRAVAVVAAVVVLAVVAVVLVALMLVYMA